MMARPPDSLYLPDIHHPDFHARYFTWAVQMLSETRETIALTRQTIAETRVLLKRADRLLAWRAAA